MSVDLTVAGVVYPFPETGDSSWGSQVTNWATAVSASTLQKNGGTQTLTAQLDLGASFGLKSLWFSSRTANVATAGQVRLARADVVSWRNEANSANVDLAVNSSNQLTFGGITLGLSAQPTFSDTATVDLTMNVNDVTADVVAGSLTNTHINGSAAIAVSKLAALTASRVVVTDGSGFLTVSSGVTAAELEFLATATSDVQTQLGTKITSGAAAIVNADVHASAAIAVSKLAALTVSRAAVTDGSGFLAAHGTTTATEVGYLTGVTSAIQTQLGTKLTTGAAALVNADVHATAAISLSKLAALTASRAAVTDGSGFLAAHGTTTATEVGYLTGVTSAIQAQLNALVSGMTLIQVYTPSAVATLDLTSVITSTYDCYLLFYDLQPATDNVSLRFRTDVSNGASFDAAGYNSERAILSGGAWAFDSSTGGTGTGVVLGSAIGNAAAEHTSGVVVIASKGTASQHPEIFGLGFVLDTGTAVRLQFFGGTPATVGPINAGQFLFSSGNIATGTVRIYGLRNSV